MGRFPLQNIPFSGKLEDIYIHRTDSRRNRSEKRAREEKLERRMGSQGLSGNGGGGGEGEGDGEEEMFLSAMDIMCREMPFNRRLLFYELTLPPGPGPRYEHMVAKLKHSLGLALDAFYPLAGRIICADGPTMMDHGRMRLACNDLGALFIEATVERHHDCGPSAQWRFLLGPTKFLRPTSSLGRARGLCFGAPIVNPGVITALIPMF